MYSFMLCKSKTQTSYAILSGARTIGRFFFNTDFQLVFKEVSVQRQNLLKTFNFSARSQVPKEDGLSFPLSPPLTSKKKPELKLYTPARYF